MAQAPMLRIAMRPFQSQALRPVTSPEAHSNETIQGLRRSHGLQGLSGFVAMSISLSNFKLTGKLTANY